MALRLPPDETSSLSILAKIRADLTTVEDQLPERLQTIKSRLAEFEAQYDMPSEVMNQRLMAGELRETDDICRWHMEYVLLQHVTQA